MADLARLVVRLEADSLKFQKELDQAKRKLAGFEGSASKTARQVGRILGTAAIAAATGLAVMAKRSIDLADATSKAAQKIGVTTESLSQLRFAADLAGVSGASLDKSLQKLNRSMSEATITSTSKAAMAFKALGVEVANADGSLRNSDDVLSDLADRMSGMRDGATKTALAMDIFGRSGADLIPLMNGGSKAIAAARAEADALGQTISGSAAKAAEQFNDNMNRLSKTMSGAMLQAVQELTPALADITDAMVEATKDGDAMRTMGSALATILKSLVTAGLAVGTTFANLGRAIGGLAAAAAAAASGEFRQAGAIIDAFTADNEAATASTEKAISALWNGTARSAEAAASSTKDSAAQIANALTGMGDAAKKAATEQASAMSTIQGMVQALQQQTDTFEQGESAVIRYRIAQGDLADTFATAGAGAEQYKNQLIALTDQLEQQRMTSEATAAHQQVFNDIMSQGRATTEAMRTPLESYQSTIADLNSQLSIGAINQETYSRAVLAAGDSFDEASGKGEDWASTVESVFENAAKNMQSSLADFLFDPFADGLDGMLNGFVTMLRKMGAELLAAEAFKMLSGSLGSTSSGGGGTGGLLAGLAGALGGVFGGGGGSSSGGGGTMTGFSSGSFSARANGGPVTGGTPFLVGERGPELFVPGSSGNIMDTRQTAGMGGTQVIMNVNTPDADSFRKSRRQVVNGVKIGFGV